MYGSSLDPTTPPLTESRLHITRFITEFLTPNARKSSNDPIKRATTAEKAPSRRRVSWNQLPGLLKKLAVRWPPVRDGGGGETIHGPGLVPIGSEDTSLPGPGVNVGVTTSGLKKFFSRLGLKDLERGDRGEGGSFNGRCGVLFVMTAADQVLL